MKAKILKALKEADGDFISGSALCEQMGISRQAVWKNILSLKEAGYQIESITKKGYKLLSSPEDMLYGPEVESRLPDDCVCKKVLSFDVVNSTNSKAKQLAEAGEKELLVLAGKQTAGKGRRGRNWKSVSGEGIYMSLLLRPKVILQKVSGLTLLASLSVAHAIQKVCGLHTQIKWPNDIVSNGKKICGILTEMNSEESFIHYVIVGIGINVNTESFPEELEKTASSIFLETGKKTNLTSLVIEVMESFSNYYYKFLEVQNMAPFIEEYNEMLVNRGHEVKIYHGMVENTKQEEIESGVAKGIDIDGSLIVSINGIEKHIISGEVSVRGILDYV